MKQRLVSHIALGLFLLALPLVGGCSQNKAGGPNSLLSSANAATVTRGSDAQALSAADATPQVGEANAAIPAALETNTFPTVPVLTESGAASVALGSPLNSPPNMQLSPPLGEAVKLIQAGVDTTVLMTFITNTTGYFMLGADEIVYLNDLGVEDHIITTMMQHDQALRDLRMNAWQTAQAATTAPVAQPAPSVESGNDPEPEVVATAPAYVTAPPMEAEPVYVSNTYFVETLSPYGSWVYVSGYGRCWRPTVAIVNPGWRPYADRGRWVYSDAGWYWLSDYTWGATTFHYGRWFLAPGTGWCWWPDTVWAPSWVSWRYTSDYCGWAPLPPYSSYSSGFGLTYMNGSVSMSFGFGLGAGAYAFVPWGSFCAPQPYRYCAPPSRVAHLYNDSTPVNCFDGGGNGRVNNRGIAPDRVRQLSRTEVRTVSLRDSAGRNARAERIDRDGRTLAVHRPQFTPAPATTGSRGLAESTPQRVRAGDSQSSTASVNPPAAFRPFADSPSTSSRTAGRPGREQRGADRPTTQAATPQVSAPQPPTLDPKPEVATAVRNEGRPARSRELSAESEPATRARVSPPSETRRRLPVAETVTQPRPNLLQNAPRNSSPAPAPSPNSSVVVIGGANNQARPSGRDYSVWSTPSPRPATPGRGDFGVRPTLPPAAGASQDTGISAGNVSRPQPGRSQPARSELDRTGNRTSRPALPSSTPVTPAVRGTPPASFNSRPVQPTQPSPAPSVTPRSQPVPAPTISRPESRPAPAVSRSTAVPAASRPALNPDSTRGAR